MVFLKGRNDLAHVLATLVSGGQSCDNHSYLSNPICFICSLFCNKPKTLTSLPVWCSHVLAYLPAFFQVNDPRSSLLQIYPKLRSSLYFWFIYDSHRSYDDYNTSRCFRLFQYRTKKFLYVL